MLLRIAMIMTARVLKSFLKGSNVLTSKDYIFCRILLCHHQIWSWFSRFNVHIFAFTCWIHPFTHPPQLAYINDYKTFLNHITLKKFLIIFIRLRSRGSPSGEFTRSPQTPRIIPSPVSIAMEHQSLFGFPIAKTLAMSQKFFTISAWTLWILSMCP